MQRRSDVLYGTRIAVLSAVLASAVPALADDHGHRYGAPGKWLAGDFHTHTYLTDGSHVQADVLANAFRFGLDWMANSEHGGTSARTPQGAAWPAETTFLGNPPAGKMWRWQSLWQYSYPIITDARAAYADKLIVQGYEWNVPTHEHASVAIVGRAEDGGQAIARHEYLFDGSDSGTTSDAYLEVSGKVLPNSHDKAVAGASWLQQHYPTSSYFIVNHPSRQQRYTIAHFRDFNNAASDVAIGFEGIPGHQKEPGRGGYDNGPFCQDPASGALASRKSCLPGEEDVTYRARTFGGADYMIAKVGGLWDALLGEGRHFYTFVNSDFHNVGGDFWPGEYAKSYTFARDENHDGSVSLNELVNGLRSGNSFAVHGDLISSLEFTAQAREHKAPMGSELEMDKGDKLKLKIRFKSPARNNNGDAVAVNHIDLIAGNITGKVSKFLEDGVTPNPDYNKETNESARVIATFTSKDWEVDEDGYATIVYHVKGLKSSSFFRLRGTNLPANMPNETDAAGNPLVDVADQSNMFSFDNTPAKAYTDLWFYSNPIFVRVSH